MQIAIKVALLVLIICMAHILQKSYPWIIETLYPEPDSRKASEGEVLLARICFCITVFLFVFAALLPWSFWPDVFKALGLEF